MNLKKITTVIHLFLFVFTTSFAQYFETPIAQAAAFSKKKTSYVHLETGETVKGNLKKLRWKKGLIEEITIMDEKGNEQTFHSKQISHSFLPPNVWIKMEKASEYLWDATQWKGTDLERDILSKGYIYLEKSEIKIRKKTYTVLLQLLNPGFSRKIKVFHDPFTTTTSSFDIGETTVAGGRLKSYFVKKSGQKTAFELKKKNFDRYFNVLFGDCKDLTEKFGDNPRWANLEQYIFDYTEKCN